jgi:hypothetical protein
MASFQLLDPHEEDELHRSRLLAVEEKPFKRITKRLFVPGALISNPTQLPTPPPEDGSVTDDSTAKTEAETQKLLEERRQFREDVLLDFAAFESSIARIQFLRNSNEREREKYAAEKLKILEAAQNVRENTVVLRTQLDEARQTLNQRKKFDELAEKITSNRLLRPREDQEANLRKLEEECRELERESETYAETWKERREQFGRIVEEGMQLRRLIRDEKEEVERREGMDGGEEDGEVGEGSRDGATPRQSQSGNATPRPDDGSTPVPLSINNDDSNLETGEVEDNKQGLKPRPFPTASNSRISSRINSRTHSPTSSERRRHEAAEGAETTMADEKAQADTDVAMSEAVETPQVTVDTPGDSEDKMDTT